MRIAATKLQFTLCLALLLAPLPALAVEDEATPETIAMGHELVRTYCAECHAVEASGDSPLAIAPHFRDLHTRYPIDDLAEALVEGIVTAHPTMPEFEFDPDQALAIIDYIKSLNP